MSKYRDQLAAQIRAALGPHDDPELPVAECVARLVAAQPAPEPVAWQPIETAPKDGSMFLCWVSAVRHTESDEGSLDTIDVSEIDFCQWRAESTSPASGYHMNMMGAIGDEQSVTHWMPLPAPPAAHSAGKGEI